MRLLRGLLRHYPFYRPRSAILKRLPTVPEGCAPFRIKRGLRISGYYPGNDVISKSLFWLGDFDPWVDAALRRLARPGDTVFDIGANIGATAMALSQCVGPTGRVVCFEPFPLHLPKLRANIACNGLRNVTVHECALSDAPGHLRMGMASGERQGMSRIGLEDGAVSCDVIADTFDNFCDQHGISKVALCKIDVEGHEASVIRGMEKSLSRGTVESLVIERHIPADAPGDEVLDLLRASGYAILRLHKRLLGAEAVACEQGFLPAGRGEPTPDFIAVRK